MATYDGDLPDPPYSPDLLADLHAGNLPESVAFRLWPLARRDPAAAAVLDGLDTVSSRLRELGRTHDSETPIPPEVAARIDHAVCLQTVAVREEQQRKNLRRRLAAVAAVSSIAVSAALVFAVITLDSDPTPTSPAAASPVDRSPVDTAPTSEERAAADRHIQDSPVIDLRTGLDAGELLALVGDNQLGPLTDTATLAGCLTANGIEPSRPLLGSRMVQLDGQHGVLLLLAGPRAPQLTALVVGPGCSASEPATLGSADIG